MSKREYKVYLAGPLFTTYEIEARKREHKLLKETFPNLKTFAPIDAPFNGAASPTNQEIFIGDYNEMATSKIFIFDLNHADEGTLLEVGLAIEMKKHDPEIEIYAFLWDLRIARGQGKGFYDKPWGYNAFVLGGIELHGHIVHKFEDVLQLMKEKGH